MKKIIKNTSLYTLGSVLPQAANLFLLPLYTRYLPPDEYGIYTSMMMFNSILIIFFTLAFDRSLNRLYYDYKNEEKKKELLGTVSILLIITSTSLLIIILLLQNYTGALFKSIPVRPYFILTFFVAYNSTFLLVPLIFFRIKHQAGKYVTLSISQFILNAGLSLIFIIVFEKKAEGLLLAQVVSGAVLIPVFFIVGIKNFKPVFKKKYLKPVAKFSLPMIPSLLAAWVINLSDRVFIEQFFSTKEVGIYALGYQIAQITAIVSGAIFQAYNPLFYETAAKGINFKSLLAKYNHIIITFILLIAFSIALFSKEVIGLLFSDDYKNAYLISIIISASYFISSSSGLLNLSIYQKKKTLMMMYFVLISAGINIVLNFIFIPQYGMYGAAIATVCTFIIFYIMKYLFARKCYFIPIKFKRIIPLVIFAIASIYLTEIYTFKNLIYDIIIKVFVYIIFIFLIFIYNKSYFVKLLELIKQRK